MDIENQTNASIDMEELVIKAQQNDMDAKRLLIIKNRGLVVSIAKRYCGYGLAVDDLIQEGIIGLILALKKYRPTINCRFSTYAYFWVKHCINRAVLSKGRMIRLPDYLYNELIKLKRTLSELEKKYGKTFTKKEISKILNIPLEKVELLMQVSDEPVRLDDEIKGSEENSTKKLMDKVPIKDVDIDYDIIANELRRDVSDILYNSHLNEREITILKYRYGIELDGAYTLEEIGQKFGLTRERIRQIEEKALSKLRRSPDIDKIAVYIGKERRLTKIK